MIAGHEAALTDVQLRQMYINKIMVETILTIATMKLILMYCVFHHSSSDSTEHRSFS